MEKTQIKVRFTIYDDLILNHQEITNIIGWEPTFICNKGELIRKDTYQKQSAWVYSTEYTNSLYVDTILNTFIQMLEPIVLPLSKYLKENGLKTIFAISLKISDNQPPSHLLPKRFIHLCSLLDADIDTDINL